MTDSSLELQYSHSIVHSNECFGGGQLNTRNTLSHPAGRSTGTGQGWQEGKVVAFLPVRGSACPGGPCITLYPSCIYHHRTPGALPAFSSCPIPPVGSQLSPPISPTLPAPSTRTLQSHSFPSQFTSTVLKYEIFYLHSACHLLMMVLLGPRSTQKKRFIWVQHHPGVKGTCVFPPHTEISRYHTSTRPSNPISPSTSYISHIHFSSLEAKVCTRTVGKKTIEGAKPPPLNWERTVSSLTWWACAQGHMQKGFPWTLANNSKENTLIHTLNTLAVLALLHVWTLLLARAAL